MTQFGFNGGSGVGWNQARFASIYDLDAQQLDAVGTIAQPTLVAPDPATLSAQSLAATGTIGQPTIVVGVVPAQTLSSQTLAGASTIAATYRCLLAAGAATKALSAQTHCRHRHVIAQPHVGCGQCCRRHACIAKPGQHWHDNHAYAGCRDGARRCACIAEPCRRRCH